MRTRIGIIIVVLFNSLVAVGQEHPLSFNDNNPHQHHFRISGLLYHTYIGSEATDGMDVIIVPSLGLDLEYWINHRWGIGLHNDLELINYKVLRGSEISFERETPFLTTLDVLWKPNKNWVILFGPGIELDTHDNFFVFRAGVEYEIELSHHFDVSPAFFYDLRDEAYDTFSIGIGIGKRF